ncbi:hypothetical protein GWI33_019092 [Rhynchophorus ferrugineus]|uniref:Mitogen-activated protein kinase kinase kinase n=1 Tax=Rhynchophorus ferrugineus TaxID=354439 RepID=A0A834I620_RHYFE|nr:hypothetical protein GWI33_019092 [Rhynchophorus ferrugineus]
MCDCPMAGVFASHESHRSWIIFKECSQNTVNAGTISTSGSTSHTSPDLNNISVLLESLDSPLRPATPDFNDPRSVEKYEEHKKLAQEYWTVQTELVLLTRKRNELLQAEAEEEQNQRKLKHMQEEKESLRLIRDLLRQQQENGDVPDT